MNGGVQSYKRKIINFLKILLVLVTFLLGSQLLFFAFQGGILLTSFMFSIEYFAHNDGEIFCWALQILLLVSLVKEFIANNKTKKGRRKKNNGTILHLFARCVSLIALYCLGGAAAPAAIECVANYYRIVLLFLSKLWIVVAVILIVKVVFYLVRYARAVIKRKRFTETLFELCDQKNIRLEQNGGIFPLDNRRKDEADLSVVHRGTKYECKFVYSLRKYDTMILTNYGEGSVVYDYRLGQVHLFRRMTFFRYDFESNSPKILIILPTSKRVIHSESGRDLDVGDRAGEYTVYTATAFLNALERDCLNHPIENN